MGYTHYFRINNASAKESMPEVAKVIKDIFKLFPEVSECLKGGNGYGEPIINESGIVFNGDARKKEHYETFRIDVRDLDFRFCKTQRHPYDLAVCLCLIVMKDKLGRKFTFDSDGCFMNDKEDNGVIISAEDNWKKARRIYNKYCRMNGIRVPRYRRWKIG